MFAVVILRFSGVKKRNKERNIADQIEGSRLYNVRCCHSQILRFQEKKEGDKETNERIKKGRESASVYSVVTHTGT